MEAAKNQDPTSSGNDHHVTAAAPTSQQPDSQQETTDDDDDLAEFTSAPFLVLASKNFQKSTIWFMLVAAFCSFRAASAFTVAIAYIHVGFRVLQTVALMLKKRPLAKVAYGLSTLMIVMMFFAAMVD